MNNVGGFVYKDQAAAEERVAQLRGDLFSLVEQLEELNESIDSHRLAGLIQRTKFNLGM